MSYKRFLKDKLIKKQRSDFKQISAQLKRANKDLRTAESMLSVDPTWAFTIIYHAMIRASRALMFAKGYLPTAKRSHKTIIEFTRLILGNEYGNLVGRFNRMRRKRHDFIYDSVNNITTNEVKSTIKIARKLINEINDIIIKEHPQKNLFIK
jgi:uncharacterized protein (UPF0332 family)